MSGLLSFAPREREIKTRKDSRLRNFVVTASPFLSLGELADDDGSYQENNRSEQVSALDRLSCLGATSISNEALLDNMQGIK